MGKINKIWGQFWKFFFCFFVIISLPIVYSIKYLFNGEKTRTRVLIGIMYVSIITLFIVNKNMAMILFGVYCAIGVIYDINFVFMRFKKTKVERKKEKYEKLLANCKGDFEKTKIIAEKYYKYLKTIGG